MNEQKLKHSNEMAFGSLLESFSQKEIKISSEQKQQLELISIASSYATQQITLSPNIYIEWYELSRLKQPFDVSLIAQDEGLVSDNEIKLKQILRQYRHYYLCHIVLNDICLGFSVPVILKQISDLAFELINVALNLATNILQNKHGVATNSQGEEQKLLVMAMGKLGGGELNFSSDIDLIFVYVEDGELDGQGHLSYRELYIRIGRLFTKLLNDKTEHGFVYRVDLRLRPWGDSGPIVINLAGLENYYQLQGRDWERYALVKACIVTGTESDKISLQQVISPFVYRRYHDFNVFSGLGSLKQQIDHVAKKKQQSLNVKLCSGGIREIEFCIQALQILQGGRHKQLQVTSILKMFELAEDETFYTKVELKTLKDAYILLRLVENRIQMLADQQTHLLPSNEEDQARLLYSLQLNTWDELLIKLDQAQLQVHAIFKQLFIEQSQQNEVNDFALYEDDDWLEYCLKLDFNEHQKVAKRLFLFFKERAIVAMTTKGRDRLNELLPSFLKLIIKRDNTIHLLDLLMELFLSIARRSVYLEMLFMHQPLLQKLIDLFAKSQWLAEEVIRFPILLESVLIVQPNYVFDKQLISDLLHKELQQVEGDVELELDVLRVFKRQQLFYIAVHEIEVKVDPLKASLYLSELASIMLQASYELNFKLMVNQHGVPEYELGGKKHRAYFGIIAYGKLGGQELHYTSDLDVIFLHNSCGEKQKTNGEKSIDNAQFFVRLAQKITQTVSLRTSSGRLYEIDARLRPNGASGFLVSSLESYQQYQQDKAWVWEHQALVRANYVAGNDGIKGQFNTIKCDVLKQIKDTQNLAIEISKMREKMFSAHKPTSAFNIKQSRGGMIDIEFMVQYFVLLNANKLSSLCEYSDNISLLSHLHKYNCIDDKYLKLINIYQSLHQQLHQYVLQQLSQVQTDEHSTKNIEVVKQLWLQCFANK